MGPKELKREVLDSGLCTNCGACVNLCPYHTSYGDSLIVLDSCDRPEGRCYAFCPRTPVDLEGLRQRLFPSQKATPELGPLQGFYMTRAADPGVRKSAQHGGTVTTLLALALEQGLIDTAIVAGEEKDFLPEGTAIKEAAGAKKHGGSRFVVSPNIAKFNEVAKGAAMKAGVVATPCQALALARMRLKPIPERDSNIDKLKLVIGLFCGWAVSWRGLQGLLRGKIGEAPILKLDIPPSQYHSLEVTTGSGTVAISLDEVLPVVRNSCRFCFDMTAEFSDISVGSARCPEGWETAKGWNQVIVRTDTGKKLLEAARLRGLLEFRDMPEGNLEKLKKASMNKKRMAVKNLAVKSGSPEELIYLDCHDPVFKNLI